MGYCVYFTGVCMSLSEWKDVATIVGIYVAVPGGLFAAFKTWQEIRKGWQQREREEKLKRIDFTLAQHRRLFDDPVLYSVLCLID